MDEAKLIRLIGVLELWADWMRGYVPRLGFPARAIGLQTGGASKSFDDMADAEDIKQCKAVEASIDDLPPVQCSAIYRRYTGATFKFPSASYIEALDAAHQSLLCSLPKKIVL